MDALVAHGDPDAIAGRVQAHLDAGADHVALHVVTGGTETSAGAPERHWRELAAVLPV